MRPVFLCVPPPAIPATGGGTSATLALTATPALAHPNPGEHGSFAAGFSHPLFGVGADHILAMIAVGLAALAGAALLIGG